MSLSVRPYTHEDRAAVRHICCETGFMGDPVDRLFSDREAFADFFTRYYTDYEPQNCYVAVADQDIVGYLIANLELSQYRRAQLRMVLGNAARVFQRCLRGQYSVQDRRFLAWFLLHSWRETPSAPRDAAHFHINLLRPWRDGRAGRLLIFPFLRSLPSRGIRRVYGQIQTYSDRRPAHVFERYGFHVYDRRRVTKFERFGITGVYVSTVVKDIEAN